jgi:hypothetical protein
MAKTTKKKRVNYLNNRDILKEIHKSKTTFCSFRDPVVDSQFDLILHDVSEINAQTIQEAKAKQVARRLKDNEEVVDIASLADTDVVFRVMTQEHVPLGPKKRTKANSKPAPKKAADLTDDLDLEDEAEVEIPLEEQDIELAPIRCNFPSFFHYRVDESGTPFVVGKSHWKGDLETGEFNKAHGKVTDKLAMMYMKLCERYATRSNWRGYTYNDEMRSQALLQLCQIGLQFDESKSDNPFAYYTAAVTNSFTRVLNIEKKMQNIRDDILEHNGLTPSWTRQFENDNTDAKYLDENGVLKD